MWVSGRIVEKSPPGGFSGQGMGWGGVVVCYFDTGVPRVSSAEAVRSCSRGADV